VIYNSGEFLNVGKHPYQRVRVVDCQSRRQHRYIHYELEGNNVTVLLGDGKEILMMHRVRLLPVVTHHLHWLSETINGDAKAGPGDHKFAASTADRTGKNGLTIMIVTDKGNLQK